MLALELTPPPARYSAGPGRALLTKRLVEEIGAAPGVARAAVTTVNPLGGGTWAATVITEVAASVDQNAAVNVNHRLISPELFETMGIPLLRGRPFTAADRARAARWWSSSAIAWPGTCGRMRSPRPATAAGPAESPLAHRRRHRASDVSDSHDSGVPNETWYVPYDQHAETAAAEHLYVMARSRQDALAIVPAIQHAIARVDPTLAPYDPVAMDTYRADSISRERVSPAFMLGFGAFGLALAALGVYGVMAFSVAQRTPGFGVRMALGAGLGDILPLVLRHSARLVALGLALGIGAAIAVNRLLAGILTEVASIDLGVVAAAGLAIVATACVACLVPAVAAARLDPVKALKVE